MPTVEKTIEISASPEAVWKISADSASLTKLYPDAIQIETDPPGVVRVGQKGHMVTKIGGRKTDVFYECTEVIENKKASFTQRPGGLFNTFLITSTFEPTKKGKTLATQKMNYELSMGYLGRALNKLVVDRTIRKNINAYLVNLKEIAELKDAPTAKS
jgi:carbon monoxide dehydrogenase subunit G